MNQALRLATFEAPRQALFRLLVTSVLEVAADALVPV
jgi:hypothetical protein